MLNIGQKIGNYTIISSKLGQNSNFGDVYRAENENGDKSALKVCIALNEKDRFSQENDILHDLIDHGGIITPHTRVIENLHPQLSYYCMELADQNIAEYMAKNPDTAISTQKGIFLQICEALKYAHEHKVVHRDLHYGNILINLSSPATTKLTDFGRAKHFRNNNLPQYPAATIWGRTDTRAPEASFQIWPDPTLDNYARSSDIYSLGIILAYLFNVDATNYLNSLLFFPDGITAFLCKKGVVQQLNPPEIDSSLDLKDRVKHYFEWLKQHDVARTLEHLQISIATPAQTTQLNKIVAKCCSPDYRERYATVNDIIEDMESVK